MLPITSDLAGIRNNGFAPAMVTDLAALSTVDRRLCATQRADPAPSDAFASRLRSVLAQPMPMVDPDTRELALRSLPLSAEARALLVRFSDDVAGTDAGC